MLNSAYKWLPGYFIFQAVFWVLHTYLPLNMTGLTTFTIASLTYLAVLLAIRYRKVFTIALVVAVSLVLLIYASDFLASYLSENAIFMEGDSSEISTSTPEESRHRIQWLMTLRDKVDYEHLFDYADWLLDRNDLEGNDPYELIFAVFVSTGLTLVLQAVFLVRWFKVFLLAPLAFFVIMWYKYVDFSWGIYLLYFAGLFGMLAMDQHERFIWKNPDHDKTHHPSWKVHLYAVGASLLLIVATNLVFWMLPLNGINSLVDAVVPNIWGARTSYDTNNLRIYSLWDTPYQNDPYELGGPVGPLNSEDPLFWVSLEKAPKEPLYLKTNVKSIYNGKNWLNPEQIFKNNFAYYKEDPDNTEILENGQYDPINGSIEMDLLKTITLISPMGTYETSLDSDRIFTSSENEGFYKSGILVRNLNTYSFKATGKDFSYAQDADYLQLSEGIEDRTVELALELGALGETDYAKVIAMTRFLTENYTYELRVPSWRTTQDFVSRFLFDTQEGYCTYFASSLTVLARINGIPARYVEGFRVDLEAFEKGNGRAKVTEADAHAWTEIYFEDLGWVIFESTPPYTRALGDDYSPTLSDLMEDPEQSDPSGETGDRPADSEINEDDYLMESDGGRADIDTVYAGPQAEEETGPGLEILIGLLIIVVVAGGIWVLKVPYVFYKNTHDHKHAVRKLYYLMAMIRFNRPESPLKTPEELFAAIRVSPEDIGLWTRVLYDREERIDEAFIKSVEDATESYISQENLKYRRTKGRVAYWRMKYMKIPRLIQ